MNAAPTRQDRGFPARPQPANGQAKWNSATAQTAGQDHQVGLSELSSNYRAVLALAWLPLVVVVACLAGLEYALWQGWLRPDSARSSTALAPAYFANLGLMSGNGFLLAWFFTLRAWCRSQQLAGSPASRVIAGPLIAAIVTSVWLWGVAVRTRADNVIVLAVVIYAPTLVVSSWLLGLATGRLRHPWEAALMTGAWATLNFACQLLYLQPSGDDPGPIMFSLSSVPILAAVAMWLATHCRQSPASPALHAS